jgi:hypothetical protein
MRESTTIAKNPQIKLPSVNSVGKTATARIGFIDDSIDSTVRLSHAKARRRKGQTIQKFKDEDQG